MWVPHAIIGLAYRKNKMAIDVVYLAYENKNVGYTIDVVKNFINSYNNHPAGIEHSFVIIAKNWNDSNTYNQLCQLAKENNAEIIDLPDDGWDFGAYFRAIKLLKNDYVVFLGSGVKVLSDNWLLYFDKAFKSDSSIQLAGAMGNWGDTKRETFPNYHIRTSAFMMKKDLFAQYASEQKFPVTKEDTYELEHGQNSLTYFVLNKGYRAVVVNSDGEIFDPPDWDFSQTFRSPGENKSMFSDKQSLYYYSADEYLKLSLETAGWGRSLKETKVKVFVAHNSQTSRLQSEVFQYIFNGAEADKNGIQTLKDNLKINISDKNDYWGELTGHYWIWKNLLPRINNEYIGFGHYNKFLDFNLSQIPTAPFQSIFVADFKNIFDKYTLETILPTIENYDIVLPYKLRLDKTVYEQYIQTYPKKEFDLAIEILDELYPEYKDAAKKVLESNEMYTSLIFIMKKDLVNQYMEWIFNILNTLEGKTGAERLKGPDMIPVRIAERFFNIWLTYNMESRNLKISNTTSYLVDMDINAFLAKCLAQIEQAGLNSNP